jgi:hypothetical protein
MKDIYAKSFDFAEKAPYDTNAVSKEAKSSEFK